METKKFLEELKHHVPFTFFATLFATFATITIIYYLNREISKGVFEVAHILHVVVSGMVTAGLYYKYRANIFYAFLVGIFGALIVGSLSDILFPWLGGNLLGVHVHFHLPVIEIPLIIFSVAILGSFLGIALKMTKMPHFLHVFISVFASLFYLMAFSSLFSFGYFFGSFLIVFIAVIIPCCISDLIFPFIFIRKGGRNEKKKI